MLKVTHKPRWFAIGAFFVFETLFKVIKGDSQMNWRKQAVEKAIVDLESHIEDLKKVKEEINWSNPPAEEIAEIMEQLFRERANIANRIFMDYPPSYPNNRYYDPDPDSPFRMADFQNSYAESYSYPIIVGRLTLNETRIDSTIKRINLFIKQLKVKSRRRSDFQENNSFQLTEAKLKQMILETMQRSTHYEKLKTLMGTMKGYFQAESLYEMLRGTFDEEEQMHMDIFFEPLILARERKAADERYKEAYAKFKALEQAFHYDGEEDYDAMEKAFYQMEEVEIAMNEKNQEFGKSFVKMRTHVKNNPSVSPDNFPRVVTEASFKIMTGTELKP